MLAIGDQADLRIDLEDLLSQSVRVTSDQDANNVAWTCSLGPHSVADREAPVRLAELALARGAEVDKPGYCCTLGATLYRADRYEESIRRFQEGMQKRGGDGDPQEWAFLAMAHHRLGQHDLARSWLERFKSYHPKGTRAEYWVELEIALLRREAEAVVLYDPIFPTDPFSR